MALAKHIQIARTMGVEAGLESYLAAPSSKIHPAYREITKRRTPKTRLDAYCSHFAEQLNQIEMVPPVVADRNITDVQGIMEAINALATRVNAMSTGSAQTTVPAATPQVEVPVITKGEAWEILSADAGDSDFPRPNDPSLPATNGQLYRLNTLGFLRIEIDA